MKNKLKIIFLSGLILSLGACTNIQDTFTGTPTYTEIEKTNFNVQEETQLFAMGSYKVNESGTAVAKMRAEEEAEISLKKQIFTETTNVLNSFFNEIHTKNIVISKSTTSDLANLVSSQLIKDAVTTNSWNNEGREFIVLAIDKNKIPEKAKGIFVTHLEGIIDDLDGAINKVSAEYLEIANPPVVVAAEETPEAEVIDKTENIESNDPVENSSSDKNAEPEVFLDDF
ncbi:MULTISPECIES: hypothetical protein [Psychrilyobacter]|uniref:Lipoprotein n=1 Tax=Psychrilyobacter piezotolerans TaxID=2293438 RepID=A0ABX9KGD6_9FUSO|nr:MULTISPECIES: hypothetical protein [Psychrilyobacter]MCS5421516.1 hypothetical protein [Psychrilyobacter sp. S5]NDI77743.1 hypothetical protein [Psychrilyobacter piezotolerans]RDE61441.1 hypothetical protein DV867_09030 [Psychrilyobacter sp. S5]REI40962.1 hypothetical protein DYH56_09030 [Psychrilyobacter piezotolerans]